MKGIWLFFTSLLCIYLRYRPYPGAYGVTVEDSFKLRTDEGLGLNRHCDKM